MIFTFSEYKISHYIRWDFTFAFLSAKSWRRTLTRVFLERRDLITIDELVIFFDPSILLPASILSRGYFLSSVESPFFPFLPFHSESFRIAERSSHSMHVEGHATRRLENTSVYPSSSSSSFFILALSISYSPFCSIVFFLFKVRHESSWKTRTLRALVFHDLDKYMCACCMMIDVIFF